MSHLEHPELELVYSKLISREEDAGWDELDNILEALDYLDDLELYRECSVLYESHKGKMVGCSYEHDKSERCFIPILVGVVENLLNKYLDDEFLDNKDRYIFQYYLALTEAKFIHVISKP